MIEHILKANKVLRRIKENPLTIGFPSLGDFEKTKIFCYSDASLGNLPSGKSSGGYVIFAVRENGKSCPIMEKAKTLRRVVRSTIAAETSAMIDALDAAYFAMFMISEMIYPLSNCNQLLKSIHIHAFTDNESLYRNGRGKTTAYRNYQTDVTAKRIDVPDMYSIYETTSRLLDEKCANPLNLTRVYTRKWTI